MLHYNIDTTENNYDKIQGDAETLNEIKSVLIKDDTTPDCVGYITIDDMPNSTLCFSVQKELGVFLGITDNSGIHLSLFNSEKLDDVVDVWGDGLYISIGLFIPEELAWKGLEKYILNGTLWNQIKWIIPDDLPESGNFIC